MPEYTITLNEQEAEMLRRMLTQRVYLRTDREDPEYREVCNVRRRLEAMMYAQEGR